MEKIGKINENLQSFARIDRNLTRFTRISPYNFASSEAAFHHPHHPGGPGASMRH